MLRLVVNRQAAKALRAVRAQLESANGNGPLMQRLVRDVGAVDVKQAVQQFATEGAAGGAPWKGLSPGYAEVKRRAIAGRRSLLKSGIHKSSPLLKGRPTTMATLVWSGAMRRSVTAPTDKHHVARARDGVLEFGTNHVLASYHQQGGGNLPQRLVVKKSAAQIQVIKRAIAKGLLVEMSRAAGAGTLMGQAFAKAAGRIVLRDAA